MSATANPARSLVARLLPAGADCRRRLPSLLLAAALLGAPCGALSAAAIDGFDELPQPDASTEPTANFGFRGALFGDTAMVSDHANNRVHVYRQDADGGWSHRQTIHSPAPDNPADDENFGRAIALQGDRAVIAAYRQRNDAGFGSLDGAVHVYQRGADGNWTLDATLTAGAGEVGECFGWSLALDGDLLLVGQIASPDVAPHAPTNCEADSVAGDSEGHGLVHVFRHDGNGWVAEAQLKPVDGNGDGDGLIDSHFGFALALSGNLAAVSADHHDLGLGGSFHGDGGYHSGRVYLYRRDGAGNWSLEASLDGDAAGDHFGYAIDLQGDDLLVGARRVETDNSPFEAGAAFLYRRQGDGSWLRQQQIDPPDGGSERGLFGNAVVLSAGHALIGELQDDDAPFFQQIGAAHLYAFGAHGLLQHLSSDFPHPLQAPGDVPAHFAGNGLAMSGRSLLAGADEAVGGSGTGRAFAFQREPWTGLYSQSLASRPSGYWQLDERAGARIYDASGWERHGDLAGGVALGASSYIEGGAARFDGIDDRIAIDAAERGNPGGDFGGGSAHTLSAWLYSEPGSSGSGIAVGSDFLSLGIDRTSGELLGRADDGSGVQEVRSALSGEGWHHLALVFDAGQLTLYVDGVAAAPLATGFADLASGARLYLGRDASGAEHFAGHIDEVALFDTALDAAAVQALSDAADIDAPPLAVVGSAPDCADTCSEDTPQIAGGATAVGARAPSFELLPGSVRAGDAVLGDDAVQVDSLSGGWRFSPDNRSADYSASFDLLVRDGADSASTTVAFTVLADDDPPQVADASGSGDEDDAQITGGIVASDIDSASLGYRIASQPGDGFGTATVDSSGNWRYQPANRSADYTASFEVEVSDASNAVLARVDVSVGADNEAPQLARNGNNGLVLAAGQTRELRFAMSDPDLGDSHRFSASGSALDDGLGEVASFDDGLLRFTAIAAGSGQLQLRVEDAAGASAVLDLPVTVNAADLADSNGDGLGDQQAASHHLDPGSDDSDGDGQPDAVEVGDPRSPVDSDGDGLLDAIEPGAAAADAGELAFVVNAASATALGLPELAGQTLRIHAGGAPLLAHDAGTGLPLGPAALAAADDGFEFPLGVLDFSVDAGAVGAAVTLTIEYPAAMDFPAAALLRKSDAAGEWRTFPGDPLDAAARRITLGLVDGDEWDGDERERWIRDPLGVAVALDAETGGGGGGGGGGASGPWLPLALGLLALRRRRGQGGSAKRSERSPAKAEIGEKAQFTQGK